MILAIDFINTWFICVTKSFWTQKFAVFLLFFSVAICIRINCWRSGRLKKSIEIRNWNPKLSLCYTTYGFFFFYPFLHKPSNSVPINKHNLKNFWRRIDPLPPTALSSLGIIYVTAISRLHVKIFVLYMITIILIMIRRCI